MIKLGGLLDNEIKKPCCYVAIGASAGGLEAIESFFAKVPRKTGIAFIVIQHLSPDYKSLMVELLSKKTKVRVKRADDNEEVHPDTIYLIPPRKNLKIFHNKLILTEQDHSRGINLPIDIFFRSLAEDQKDNIIGVILSGTGSDGVRGIRAVKEAGGLIMIQSPESAKFDGMPRASISTGLADFILTAPEMPEKIISFINNPYTDKINKDKLLATDEERLNRIFALLREKTKVDFTYYKPSTVVRRIERRLTVNQMNNIQEYVNYLEQNSSEISILYRELLIGVTSFFRNNEIYDEIANIHLENILKNNKDKQVRLWVAGCSTGEEAYSLAILVKEKIIALKENVDVKIFATDIDKEAIIYAGTGEYPESIAADVSIDYLTKYFTKQGGYYKISRSIREMVVFAQHNLVKDPPFTNIDFISCRNLLIYFQPILQKRVMEMFNFSLKSNGIMWLGTSETIGDASDYFKIINHKAKIFQSKGRKIPNNANRLRNEPYSISILKDSRHYSSNKNMLRFTDQEKIFERYLESLSGRLIDLSLIVNEQFEIVHIIGDSSEYFKLPVGKLVNDISKMAIKEISIPITTGLQKVFTYGKEVKYSHLKIAKGSKETIISINIFMLPKKSNQELLCAILINKINDLTSSTCPEESQYYDINEEAEQRIKDLEQELQFNRENLQATIEELETSNEELQATNEELLASNEELQSTNEELQSVNEELYTVNSEYQLKIVELTDMTNDMDNLFELTNKAIIFLDENLNIRKFTPPTKNIFRMIESDIGRPLSHINHTLEINIIDKLNKVLLTGRTLTQEVKTINNLWYLMKISPYNIGYNTSSGLLLSFIDINELKEYETRILDEQAKITSLQESYPVGLIYLQDYTISGTNKQFADMLKFTPEEIRNLSLQKLFFTKDEYDNIVNSLKSLQIGHDLTIETILKSKDNQQIRVLLKCALNDDSSHKSKFTIAIVDLSKKISAEKMITRLELEQAGLMDLSDYGIVYHNKEGEVIKANHKAEEILGLRRNTILGKYSTDSDWQAIHPDGSVFKGQEHPAMISLRDKIQVNNVLMGVHNPKLNKTKWIEISSKAIVTNDKNELIEAVAVFKEVGSPLTQPNGTHV